MYYDAAKKRQCKIRFLEDKLFKTKDINEQINLHNQIQNIGSFGSRRRSVIESGEDVDRLICIFEDRLVRSTDFNEKVFLQDELVFLRTLTKNLKNDHGNWTY